VFQRLLIANRGEIAVRVIRTCRRLGITPLAVYSEADRDAPWVGLADEALAIGPAEAAASYLDAERLLDAARRGRADALHPGYGFLSENAAFARACQAAGLIWVGPHPGAIERMGSKLESRRLAAELGVAVVPGYDGEDASDAALLEAADKLGFPLLIKASAGGGGRGIRTVSAAAELPEALELARREALAAFGDERLILERRIRPARHVEVQVAGDRRGNLIHLFERECSIQRRHQKVLEEAPAPGLPAHTRERLQRAALALARAIGYDSLGTVEFVVDARSGEPFFLEMNTRLQVEHPTTEQITGLDLVELQLRAAAGEPLGLRQEDVRPSGWAVEVRLCAEEPERDFAPRSGTLAALDWPELPGLRVDAGVHAGSRVPPHYDSLLAKLIAHGPDRDTALGRLAEGLAGTRALGLETNLEFLRRLVAHPALRAAELSTEFVEQHALAAAPPTPDALPDAALAALALGALEREAARAGRASPWRSLGAWRLLEPAGHPARMQRFLERDGQLERVVAIGDSQLDWGEGAVEVRAQLLDPHTLAVERDGRQLRVGVACQGGRIAVTRGGRTSTWRELSREEVWSGGRASGAAGGAARALVAPFPGVVREVRVRPGDRVAEGDVLVVLEAMKMMHNLRASGAGVVAEVRCAPGDSVEGGARLVAFASEAR
jgi:acetyl/propionyl-CoA carboxylase alpha subunit